MGIRRFAVSVTSQAFSDAAFAFQQEPSADNWMKLDRVMKAHQTATLTPTDTLQEVLKDAQREQIVSALVVLFDDVTEAIQREMINGSVKLIKAKAA